MRKLRRERMSIRRIAELAGVSKTTVEKYTVDIARQRAIEADESLAQAAEQYLELQGGETDVVDLSRFARHFMDRR